MKHKKKFIFILIGIFLITQLFGLLIINLNLSKELDGNSEWDDLAYNTEVQEENDFYFILFFVVIIFGSLFYLFLFKKKKFKLIKSWYFFAIFFSVSYALYPFIKHDLIVSLIALILAFLKVRKNNFVIHNVTEVLVYAGVASILVPILSIKSVFSLLILISLYDIYAVFHSKHMVDLAKSQMKLKLFSGLALPKEKMKMSNLSGESEDHVKVKGKTNERLKQNKNKMAFLGGGDVIFPLLFSGVVLKTFSIYHSLFILVGSTIGLFLLFLLGKKGKFYPAMPYLSLSIIISWFISVLLL